MKELANSTEAYLHGKGEQEERGSLSSERTMCKMEQNDAALNVMPRLAEGPRKGGTCSDVFVGKLCQENVE